MLRDIMQSVSRCCYGARANLLPLSAGVGFFLIFPGVLFYCQFSAMGLIPFSRQALVYAALIFASFAVFSICLPSARGRLREMAGSRYALCAQAFILCTSIWILVHYLSSDSENMAFSSWRSFRSTLIWFCLFFISSLLPLESRLLRRSFLLSAIIIFSFLLYFCIDTRTFVYRPRLVYGQSDITTYQGYAQNSQVIFLFLIASYSTFKGRVMLILGGVFVLFMLISRAEFYAFIAITTVLCVIMGLRERRYFFIPLLVGIQVFLLFQFAGEGHRHIQIFALSMDASWQSRLALQGIAIQQITEAPFWGSFGADVLDTATIEADPRIIFIEPPGYFAHNALSAWVSYGFLGFVWYVFLILFAFSVSAYHVVVRRQDTPIWTLTFAVNFVCLLLIVLARSVYWIMPALGWGLLVGALLRKEARGSQSGFGDTALYRRPLRLIRGSSMISGHE